MQNDYTELFWGAMHADIAQYWASGMSIDGIDVYLNCSIINTENIQKDINQLQQTLHLKSQTEL